MRRRPARLAVAGAVTMLLGCGSTGGDEEGPQASGIPLPGQGGSSTGAPDPTTSSGAGPSVGTGEASGTTAAADDTGELPIFDVGSPGGADVPTTTEDCDELVATIRDFSQSHPDFETYTGSMAYTGLLLPMLDGAGQPQLDPAYGGPPMITSATTFAQWYTDVPGTNHTVEVPLMLTDEGTGELVFDSTAFFPIDGFGFGNEGNSHNFHFTTEVRTSFTYQGGEVFGFRGDDDIWVFVNGQLALDLGGLHSALEASIDMDSLGLVVGQTYPMDIFHAERHTDQSNFRIVTTIACFQPPPG